jgi:hypothetical protein
MAARQSGVVTQDLGMPMAPILFAAAACALILAVRSLLCAIRTLAGEAEA